VAAVRIAVDMVREGFCDADSAFSPDNQ